MRERETLREVHVERLRVKRMIEKKNRKANRVPQGMKCDREKRETRQRGEGRGGKRRREYGTPH